MREVKFRAWDEERKRMYNGDEIEAFQELNAWLSYGGLAIYRIEEGEYTELYPLQYTGLNDKNGVEIYEGDIIRVENLLVETIKPFQALVEWDKTRFALNEVGALNISNYPALTPHGVFGPYNTLSDFGQSLEVIGNKFTHPHLLEATQ